MKEKEYEKERLVLTEKNTPLGEMLIEELPTVLDNDNSRALLDIHMRIAGKIIHSNIHDEILLGKSKFDPFQVIAMTDKIAAMISFWSTVLAELNERIEETEEHFAIVKSRIDDAISTHINSVRTKAGMKKPASAAEIENYRNKYFDNVQEKLDDFTLPNGSIVIDLDQALEDRKTYNSLKIELKELNRKKRKIAIVNKAWEQKGFMIRTHAELLITMINNNLIRIPEDRKVYENW